MSAQNFINLSPVVRELSWSQRKTTDENNIVIATAKCNKKETYP